MERGTNPINSGGTVDDKHVVISGGTNTVEAGGLLKVLSGGAGLEMTGSTLTLNSSSAVAGKLLLQGDLTTFASAATSFISSGLALANAGTLDLDGGVRIFSVADGAAATDLNISAAIGNGALTKSGAGTLVLSGSLANTYFGLTTISAGILDLQKSNGVNAFSGNTTVNGGVLRWQADEQIGNLVNLTLSSGTVNLNGHTETLGSFSNNGGSFMTGAGTLQRSLRLDHIRRGH